MSRRKQRRVAESVLDRAREARAHADLLEANQRVRDLTVQEALANRDGSMRAAESWLVNGTQIMNQLDYNPPGWGLDSTFLLGSGAGLWISNNNGRYQGRDWPFIQTDLDIAAARGMARYVTTLNAVGKGIEINLKGYVIGDGFTFSAGQKKQVKLTAGLVSAVQDVIDDFFDLNHWKCNRDREIFWRGHRDGEVFPTLYPDKTGRTRLRITEPEQILDPGKPVLTDEEIQRLHGIQIPCATNWTFGVHAADHDVETVFGYAAQFEPGAPFHYLPATHVIHWKRNTDCNVKRGMSDFVCAWEWLTLQAKLLRNTGEGAATLAAIAYIVEHSLASSGQVKAMRQESADFSWTARTQAGNSKTYYRETVPPGSRLDIPKGQQFQPGPMGAERGQAFLGVVQGILRQVATRFAMSEGQISGDDSNNNRASAAEAGSRFHTYASSEQGRTKEVFADILWRVLYFAYQAGRFQRFGYHRGGRSWAEFRRDVVLNIEAPDIDPKAKLERTQHREILGKYNVLSRKTWQSQEGLDHEEEDGNIDQDKHPIAQGGGQQPNAPGGDGDQGGPQQLGIPGLAEGPPPGGGAEQKPPQSSPPAKQAAAPPSDSTTKVQQRSLFESAGQWCVVQGRPVWRFR